MYASALVACLLTLSAVDCATPATSCTDSGCATNCERGCGRCCKARGCGCERGGCGHCGCGHFGYHRDGMPWGWRYCSTCDLAHDTYFLGEDHGYYYFRPYNYSPIANHQEYATRWGQDARNPYSNAFFQRIYQEVEARDPQAVIQEVEDVPAPDQSRVQPQPAQSKGTQRSLSQKKAPRKLDPKNALTTSIAREATIRR